MPLRADELPLCPGKRQQRINARPEHIDCQRGDDVLPHLAAFLPAYNERFKRFIYLRPKAEYIFHRGRFNCLSDLFISRAVQSFKRVRIFPPVLSHRPAHRAVRIGETGVIVRCVFNIRLQCLQALFNDAVENIVLALIIGVDRAAAVFRFL